MLNKTAIFLFSTLLTYIYINIFYFFIKITTLGLVFKFFFLIFVVYFFTNTWYYFYNIYKYSKYTSSVQRFWKRSYMLFWLIEFFLFCIYIYLFLISPKEVYYYNSSPKVNFINQNIAYVDDFIFFLSYLCCAVASLFVFFKKINKLLFYVVYYIHFIVISLIFLFEFNSFFFSIISLTQTQINQTPVFSKSISLSNGNFFFFYNNNHIDEAEVARTYTYYIAIITILKFWHIMFIFILNVLISSSLLYKQNISFDSISIVMQNTLYVFCFYCIYTIYIFFDLISITVNSPYRTHLPSY